MVIEITHIHSCGLGTSVTIRNMKIQYCAKVMQAKCANFVLCSRDFSMKVRSKVRVKFHGVSNDNSLEQRVIFL